MTKKFRFLLFVNLCLICLGCFVCFGFFALTGGKTVFASTPVVDGIDSKLTVLVAAQSGDYTLGNSDRTLTKVANQSASATSQAYLKYKTNAELTSKGIDISDKKSSEGAFIASVHTGYPTCFNSNVLHFAQSVNVNNIENLYIHAYVNFTTRAVILMTPVLQTVLLYMVTDRRARTQLKRDTEFRET